MPRWRPWSGLREIWRGEIGALDLAPMEAAPWAEATWELTHPRIVGKCVAGEEPPEGVCMVLDARRNEVT
ncbi:MAG: hypothetical protein R6V19_11920, partial [Armatimonadota bacterium]